MTASPQPPVPKSLIVEYLSDAPDEEQDWIWRGRIPKDKVTLVDGKGGAGKTRSLASILTRVLHREDFPDGLSPEVDPGYIFFITRESNSAELRRVFRDQGATDEDLDYLVRISGTRDESTKRSYVLNIEVDWPLILPLVQRLQPIAIVIDPLIEFHTRNDVKPHEVRALMAFLDDIAQASRTAIIALIHWNKRDDAPSSSRFSGSHQYDAGVKSRITVSPDRKNEELKIFHQEKHNLSGASSDLAFEVNSKGQVVWTDIPSIETTAPGQALTTLGWLRDTLTEYGPLPVSRVLTMAPYSRATIYRAKSLIPEIMTIDIFVGDEGRMISHWDIRCDRNLYGLTYGGGVKVV